MRFHKHALIALIFTGATSAHAEVDTAVAGIGIAGSNDHAFAWYQDGFAASGSPGNLDIHRTPYAYSPAAGKLHTDIVAMAISNTTNHVFAWYADGTVSEGTSRDLDAYHAPQAFSLPQPWQTPADIVGVSVSGAGNVTAWYKDCTYSVGTPTGLGAEKAPRRYALARGYGADDVLDMATSGNNVTYVWYKNGFMSAGTPDKLDAAIAHQPYAQHLTLRSSFGGPSSAVAAVKNTCSSPARGSAGPARGRIESGASDGPIVAAPVDKGNASSSTGAVIEAGAADRDRNLERTGGGVSAGLDDDDDFYQEPYSQVESGLADGQTILTGVDETPGPSGVYFPTIGNKDPMVAAGRNFVLTSQQGDIELFDKQGKRLRFGADFSLSGYRLFADFVEPTARRTVNVNSFNGLNNCNDETLPQTRSGERLCVAEVYDLRTYFDVEGDRFIVLGAIRNVLWTDIYLDPDQPKRIKDKKCRYDKSKAKGDEVDTDENCDMARRHIVFAISRTEDPRDGFYTYVIKDNNYRDFPWATLSGDNFVIAHKGDTMPDGPVATVFSLKELREGNARPSYFNFHKGDVNGHRRVLLPDHYGGGLDGHTLLVAGQPGLVNMRIFAFAAPTARFQKPPVISTQLNVHIRFPIAYRDGYLHFVKSAYIDPAPDCDKCLNVSYVRAPVSIVNNKIVTSKNASQGFRVDHYFGKYKSGASRDIIYSYERPALAVNKNGDVLVSYIRYPIKTPPPGLNTPDAGYSIWYADESMPRSPATLIKGQAPLPPEFDGDNIPVSPLGAFLDYATVTVDPVDDETFWIANGYVDNMRAYRMVLGKVEP